MVFYFIVMHVVSHSVIAQFCFRGAKPLKGKEDALLTYSSLFPNRLDRHVYVFRHCIAGSSSQPRAVPVQKWTDDLEVGHVAELEGRESRFWEELIDKYLLPLEKDPEKEKKIQGELIVLRNTTCLFFFLINGLFVVLVLTLQYVAQDSSNLSIKVTLLPLAFSLRMHILLFYGIKYSSSSHVYI